MSTKIEFSITTGIGSPTQKRDVHELWLWDSGEAVYNLAETSTTLLSVSVLDTHPTYDTNFKQNEIERFPNHSAGLAYFDDLMNGLYDGTWIELCGDDDQDLEAYTSGAADYDCHPATLAAQEEEDGEDDEF